MEKLWNILKLVGILVGVVLFVGFLFVDVIDLFIPGDFPDWVTCAELIFWTIIGIFALATSIKKQNENKRR